MLGWQERVREDGPSQALERLNPAREATFNVDEEYPRWRLVRDRKSGKLDDAIPITGTFILEPADHAAIEELVGPQVVTQNEVTISRDYATHETSWDLQINESRAVRHLLDEAGVGWGETRSGSM